MVSFLVFISHNDLAPLSASLLSDWLEVHRMTPADMESLQQELQLGSPMILSDNSTLPDTWSVPAFLLHPLVEPVEDRTQRNLIAVLFTSVLESVEGISLRLQIIKVLPRKVPLSLMGSHTLFICANIKVWCCSVLKGISILWNFSAITKQFRSREEEFTSAVLVPLIHQLVFIEYSSQ